MYCINCTLYFTPVFCMLHLHWIQYIVQCPMYKNCRKYQNCFLKTFSHKNSFYLNFNCCFFIIIFHKFLIALFTMWHLFVCFSIIFFYKCSNNYILFLLPFLLYFSFWWSYLHHTIYTIDYTIQAWCYTLYNIYNTLYNRLYNTSLMLYFIQYIQYIIQ